MILKNLVTLHTQKKNFVVAVEINRLLYVSQNSSLVGKDDKKGDQDDRKEK